MHSSMNIHDVSRLTSKTMRLEGGSNRPQTALVLQIQSAEGQHELTLFFADKEGSHALATSLDAGIHNASSPPVAAAMRWASEQAMATLADVLTFLDERGDASTVDGEWAGNDELRLAGELRQAIETLRNVSKRAAALATAVKMLEAPREAAE